MKKTTLMLLAGLFALNAQSQDKKSEDLKAIKSMCGCYEVKFNFAETFNYSKDTLNYKPSERKIDYGLEWVELLEDTPNKVVMQHLLIVGNKEDDIVKHWRQDWLYENRDLYSFFKDRTWKYEQKSPAEVKGQWTQKVYQVDDSPRYEGTATWSHQDGRHYWENTTDAPLPRREHTKRNDYNVLKRTNVHEITNFGWIHDQDNDKLIRNEKGESILLAQEKGHDVYKKVEDSKCKLAQNWWKKNAKVWEKVRTKWSEVYAQNKDLSLEEKVDRQQLFMKLFALKPSASAEEVNQIINQFVIK
ncbi:MAG: hypothetical protein K2Q03_09025 [Sphingobacteriaceae bacterium]|nr:hypothetical protein [Sphingobacteriaceae bacterium]